MKSLLLVSNRMKPGFKITTHKLLGEPAEGTHEIYLFFSAIVGFSFDDDYNYVTFEMCTGEQFTTPLTLDEVIQLVEG
jgi:hypothetical protein